MSQASPTIGANKSGLAYRLEDNDGKKALLTHHKGASAPSYAEAGMIWLDDSATPWALKFYDGSDWIVLGTLHAGSNAFLPFLGTGPVRLAAYAEDTGTENEFVITPVPALPQHQAGQIVILKPAHDITDAPTLTIGGLDACAVVLPDGSDPAEGDMLAGQIYVLVYDGTQYVVTNPNRTASLPAGSTVACQSAAYSTYAAINSIIPLDNTIPQAGEGTEILAIEHAAQSAGNKIRLRFSAFGTSTQQSVPIIAALYIDSGAAVQACAVHVPAAGQSAQLAFEYEYEAPDTDTHRYSLRVGPGGVAAIRLNGSGSARLFGGTAAARLTLEETKA